MLTIPIGQGNAFFQQRVELEGVNYVLDFAWVARARVWSLSVYTDDGILALAGIAITTNRPLFRRFHHRTGVPPGELLYVDLTGNADAPAYDGLTELVYFSAEEWAARKEDA